MGQVELPAELQHKLVWMVAAALRHYIVQQHRVAAVDAAIEETASALIAAYDEGATLEARAVRLARRLDAAEPPRRRAARPRPFRRHAALVHRRRSRCSARSIMPPPGRCSPIRAAAARRSCCAPPASRASPPPPSCSSLNSRGPLVSGAEGDAAAEQLDLYDTLDLAAARDVLRLWQADPGYRASVARISTRARPAAEAA